MAIAPSNNLLAALSQLQGNARPTAPARPAPSQQALQTGGTAQVQNSFAAQLANTDNAIRTSTVAQAQVQTSAASQGFSAPVQSQSRPIPTRGGYLGQHVNIVV